MVDSVSVRVKNARVEKMLLYIRIQWNAGTACVSECVLKTLACRGLRVGPSKCGSLSEHCLSKETFSEVPQRPSDTNSSLQKIALKYFVQSYELHA